MFELNEHTYENADPENLEGRIAPGQYHIQIEEVIDNSPDHIDVSYQVLAGSVPGQEGQTGKERLFLSEKALKRVMMFIIATKLASKDQLIEWKKAGKNVQLDLTKAEGRQMCAELVKGDKGYVNWSFGGIFAVDDPNAKEIPKNDGMLATAGVGNGDAADDVAF